MRKLIVLLAILFLGSCLTYPVWAEEEKKEEPKYHPFECPKTHMTDQKQCFECHVKPSFQVKEVLPCSSYQFPNMSTKLIFENGKKTGYFYLQDISDRHFREAIDYFYIHQPEKIVLEIHSPGGSLFDAWRIKGMIDEATVKGLKIETRIYGLAASAGFLIFCAAPERVATETAELMWHELITGEMFAIKSPADKEDEAKVLRHLQDVANNFIANKSKVPKETLDAKIRKKEFWISGKEAFEMGFVTRLMR